MFEFSGQVCRLHPAVTLRGPYIHGRHCAEPQSMTKLLTWGKRKGLSHIEHMDRNTPHTYGATHTAGLMVGGWSGPEDQCRSGILGAHCIVQSPSGAGNFGIHLAETCHEERLESHAGLIFHAFQLLLWHKGVSATHTWDFGAIFPREASIGERDGQGLAL